VAVGIGCELWLCDVAASEVVSCGAVSLGCELWLCAGAVCCSCVLWL